MTVLKYDDVINLDHYFGVFWKTDVVPHSCKGSQLGLDWFRFMTGVHFPSKHLLVFKTSWRHLQGISWRRLEHVFSVTILRLPRRLGRRGIVTLKTSSRHLGGKHVCWWYLYLKNLNVYLTNLCFTNLYLTNLRRIQNALLRTQ